MILKPYSRGCTANYIDFLTRNYFVLIEGKGLKRINQQGANRISKLNDPDFSEIKDPEVFSRKFEDVHLSEDLINESEKKEISEITGKRLENIEENNSGNISFNNLAASFSIEMIDILWMTDIDSKEMVHAYEVIEDSYEFSEKSESFSEFNSLVKLYRKYLDNPVDIQLFEKILSGLDSSLKDYFDNPFTHFILGLMYHRPTKYHDIDKALVHFNESRKISEEIENQHFTALCDFMSAWLYYIKSDIDKSIQLSLKAIDNEFMYIPEIYFNLSKYYASKKDAENAIKYLDESVRRFDRFYTIKADMDKDFDLIKIDLLEYFNILKEEEKNKINNTLLNYGIKIINS